MVIGSKRDLLELLPTEGLNYTAIFSPDCELCTSSGENEYNFKQSLKDGYAKVISPELITVEITAAVLFD
jgi:hypothetical protein